MTMTNGRKPPAMPATRGANIPPAPPGHNAGPLHEEYSDEAARAAQRYYNMAAEIARLTNESEEWRHRAIAAEREIARVEQRERELSAKLDAVSDRLTSERDTYKDRLTTLKAEFSTAGNIILHCIKVSEMMAGGEAASEVAEPQTPRLDLQRLADEIGTINADEPDLPRAVTAGPRIPPES
jgi:chromosome segregation ATPase